MSQILKTNCVIYTSISSSQAANETCISYEEQRDYCMKYINSKKQKGFVFYKEYCGFSDNPSTALNKMLTDIKKGQIKCVVLYKLDMIGSNAHQLYNSWNIFKKYGVTLVPIKSINDPGYKGHLNSIQLFHFSKFESDVLRFKEA